MFGARMRDATVNKGIKNYMKFNKIFGYLPTKCSY